MKKQTNTEKKTPFYYLGNINKGVVDDEVDESIYNQFLINRGLSLHIDTVAIANEMNMYGHVTDQMHYDYMINMVSSRPRYAKWPKPKHHEDAKALSQYYGLSMSKSYDLLGIIDKEDLLKIKEQLQQMDE